MATVVSRPLHSESQVGRGVLGVGAIDGEIDPLEAGGEGHEGFVGGRGIAVAHFLEGAGDGAVLQAEVSSGLLVGVAFGEERENFAIALGGIARRHGFRPGDLPSRR